MNCYHAKNKIFATVCDFFIDNTGFNNNSLKSSPGTLNLKLCVCRHKYQNYKTDDTIIHIVLRCQLLSSQRGTIILADNMAYV